MNTDTILMMNCSGTLTNMMINSEILERNKSNSDILKDILYELKELNRRLKDGNKLCSEDNG